MPTLQTFEKQPGDTQDYDVDYTEWLAGLLDTAAEHSVVADPGIEMFASSAVDGVVKVWTRGGVTGKSYKITTTLITTGGRVKEAEITIKVKET